MEKVLPKGWVETPIENLFNLVYGKSISTKDLLNSDYNGDLYDVYGANGIIGKFSNYSYKNSKVIISCRGAASGKIHKTNPYSFISSNSIILDEINEALLNLDFVKYVMTIAEKSAIITGTAQPQITIQLLKDLKIPLPPLPEQERIVAKLDKLFAQHEKIKKALDRIPQLLKTFRQQVLTQAVTGKLTEQWREGKDLGGWKKYTVREISDTRLGKMLDKAKNSGSEYPYLGNIDVQWNEINTDNLKRIRIDDAEFEKFKLVKGDVLVCEGGEAGRAAIWQKEDTNIIFQKALHRVRLYPKFLPEILLYNLELDTKSGRIAELYTGTTIKHLTGQNFAKYVVKYCSVTEQQEIVRRVESLFAKADAIESRYQTLKAKIDNLPQAILHKAFKGELVPQLPTDGDAKDLLAEIMALKEDVKGRKKK